MNKVDVSNKLNDIREKMCDSYCKYPHEAVSQEMLERICEYCPLHRGIMEIIHAN